MSGMRARTIPAEGPAAAWDPASPEAFTALAGPRLVRIDGEAAVVLTEAGAELPLPPGCLVIVPEGREPVFSTPEQAQVLPG